MAAPIVAGEPLRSARLPDPLPHAELADRVRAQAGSIRDAASKAGVRLLGFFGSVARREDHPGSDIDLLIDVPDGVGLFALGRLKAELRDLLGAEIDLVPMAGLKPRVRRSIEVELQPI